MKRVGFFLLILVFALVVLAIVIAWYVLAFQSGTASVSGMMGQMMGNQNLGGVASPMPSYVWFSIIGLFVLIAVGVVGTAYYLAYREITPSVVSLPKAAAINPLNAEPAKLGWSTLLRTSKPDEKRVLEVLSSHGGKYLQKYIVKESGLSKLRTHRIVSRFAERGIVSVSKSGNTNEVSLSPWLNPETPS